MSSSNASAVTLELEPSDNERLANLCGQLDDHLRLIEKRLGISIAGRGNIFSLEGEPDAISAGRRVLRKLYRQTEREVLTPAVVNLQLQQSGLEEHEEHADAEVNIRTRRGLIRGRGPNQKRYLERIAANDVNFGVGPAGTGKTFLAVACAVDALEKDGVQRIVLVRPAVEAGERLGFLPGDLAQKVDPYLRPLHDALFEMLGFERAARLTERNVIEVAPLAYMRGRTLNDAFVILDEAQNTTPEQMKMFLTRIGFGSRAVITGDLTQIDLPPKITSGLRQAINLLKSVDGVSQTFFDSRDVVRHPIVRRIVEAYDQAESDAGGEYGSRGK
ncbi:MAG: AAA family ATPase [Gammaproteobacteria bacterium]|jgi:phosphate starvation-inducible PhoH-like protein|nr:AAA family ATPase [Gammaproteobacteria bacterium]